MPEGDTVWLTAHRLNQALAGRTVSEFELRVPRLALSDLSGSQITEVVSRGKHILMRFDNDHTLHSHLRMDGSWQISRPSQRVAGSTPAYRSRGARIPARPQSAGRGFDIRAVVGNTEWRTTGHRVHDLDIARTSTGEPWVSHLGPDLLGPDWDPHRAVHNLGLEPSRPIVEALLDQRILAGVGNMYAAELLFMTGTYPLASVASVLALPAQPQRAPAGGEGNRADAIVETAHRVLRANRDHPEQSTTGSVARGEQHWVYMRAGQPCRRCRTPLLSAIIGVAPQERTTFWCPRCQPAPP